MIAIAIGSKVDDAEIDTEEIINIASRRFIDFAGPAVYVVMIMLCIYLLREANWSVDLNLSSHQLRGMDVVTTMCAATALVVVIITILTIIFGELVPKRLGQLYPETVARLVARPMNWLSTAARPLVALLSRPMRQLEMGDDAARGPRDTYAQAIGCRSRGAGGSSNEPRGAGRRPSPRFTVSIHPGAASGMRASPLPGRSRSWRARWRPLHTSTQADAR